MRITHRLIWLLAAKYVAVRPRICTCSSVGIARSLVGAGCKTLARAKNSEMIIVTGSDLRLLCLHADSSNSKHHIEHGKPGEAVVWQDRCFPERVVLFHKPIFNTNGYNWCIVEK